MNNNIMQFQNNDNFIELISAGKKLKIFIKTWNEKYFSIVFSEYFRVCINFNIPAEIGEIKLKKEDDCKEPDCKELSLLIIRSPWDDDLIFSAYVGNYTIEEINNVQ